MRRENPKSEAPNPKQYPMTKIQMMKTVGKLSICFEHLSICILDLFRISDFDIRI